MRENCTSRTQVVNPMPPIMEPGEFFMPYPLEVEVGGATVFVVPGRAVRAAVAAVAWKPPAVGQRGTWTRTFTAEDVECSPISPAIATRSISTDFAARTRPGRLIVHGGLTTGLFNALVAEVLPGPGSVFLHQEWDYPAPVYIGDTVTAEAEVIEARADKPITTLRCVARRDDGTEVLAGRASCTPKPTDPR